MAKTYVYTAFGGRENERFVDLPTPVPAQGQLLVRVHAAGVNPRDWKERAGHYAASPLLSGPMPMGSEVAGVVEELGSEVDGFAVGDAVFGGVVESGAFAEYSLVLATETAHKPESVSFLEAATMPLAGATAYTGLQQLQLMAGETLLIIGIGGGVGIFAAQIAMGGGAHVIGTASAAKKTFVESIGAVHVAYGTGCLARLRAAAPAGIDAAFDMVGDDAMRELGPLVADGSRIVAAAHPTAAAEFGGQRVGRRRDASVLDDLAKMLTAGTLSPLVTAVFPLDRVGDALALVEEGHITGKVAIEVI